MTKLLKLHGLSNDFLVIANPADEVGDSHARQWCARHTGVGADGLLVLRTPGRAGADLDMRLINAEGGYAEMSGNGIRCLVHAARYLDLVDEARVSVDTDAGLRVVESTSGDVATEIFQRVDMGAVASGPGIPAVVGELVPDRPVLTLNVGNPHLVIGFEHFEEVNDLDLAAVGAAIERAVPGGVNVSVIAPTAFDEIALRVWERGVGLTAACGTGACASAVAAHEWGWVGGRVRVAQPGGAAIVTVGSSLELEGPSEVVAECLVPDPHQHERG